MNIKILLILIELFTFSLSLAQSEISNTRTDKHVQITGTKFFLLPSPGFISATNFQGLQQLNSGASILVAEIPGPFSETTKGFNEQGLKTQGVILKAKQELRVNGYQGLLLKSEQFAYGTNYSKHILVFGDAKTTYMVTGTFPKEVVELEKDIQNSMFSVVYEAGLEIDPLSTVSFAVDTENTKLKFGKIIMGSLLYTTDGMVPTESSDKTMFVVGLSYANESIDRKLTALNRIKRLPYTDLKIDEDKINEIEIDEISGYEIVGEGRNPSGRTMDLVYQVMLFTDNGYYIIVGTAKSDFEQNLELFKKVARTFRRK